MTTHPTNRLSGPLLGILRSVLGCCTLLVVTACKTEPTGDIYGFHAIFVGTVKGTAGTPIVGAALQFHDDPLDGCGGFAAYTATASTHTDGSYRADFVILSTLGSCVRVVATAPGFFADSLKQVNVPFADLTIVADSVKTDFVLRRSAS